MKLRPVSVVPIFVLLANVPVWLAGWRFGFSVTGLFNLEYVLIGVLALFVGPALTVALLLGATLCDLAYNIGQTYMLSPRDLLASASSMPLYLATHLQTLLLVLLAITASCLLAGWSAQHRFHARERSLLATALLLVIGVAGVFDLAHGKLFVASKDCQGAGLRLVRNSVHRLAVAAIAVHRAQREGVRGAQPMSAASSALMTPVAAFANGQQTRQRSPNVVLVLVESWGLGTDGRLNENLTAPYRNPALSRQYRLTTGTVAFRGATVSGEMRELCSSSLGLGVLQAAAPALKGCLPARMQSMGYRTVAVHGFVGAIFERNSWYKRMHFDQTWFLPQLRAQGLDVCPGPFPGICDAAIARWIGAGPLRQSDPQFVYWVTLNSHLPVPVENKVADPPSCSTLGELADDALCAWYRLVFNVHRSVAALAMEPQSRPTLFLIVGDHAPPFARQDRRGQFSATQVPYVVLEPRSLEQEARPLPPPRSLASHRPEHAAPHHHRLHRVHPGEAGSEAPVVGG